jgi:hypothetical protein
MGTPWLHPWQPAAAGVVWTHTLLLLLLVL